MPVNPETQKPRSQVVNGLWGIGAVAIVIGLWALSTGASDGPKIAGFAIIGGLVAIAVGIIVNAIEKSK